MQDIPMHHWIKYKPDDMYYCNDLVPCSDEIEQFPESFGIEIQLWEAHTNDHLGVKCRLLAKYSLDEAPADTSNFSIGRVAYRFARDAWFGRIKPFLIQNRIPVSIRFVRIETMQARRQVLKRQNNFSCT